MRAASTVRTDYRKTADALWYEADQWMMEGRWARAKDCWEAALMVESALFAEIHDPEPQE